MEMKTLNENIMHHKDLEKKCIFETQCKKSENTLIHLRGSGKTSEIEIIVQFILSVGNSSLRSV